MTSVENKENTSEIETIIIDDTPTAKKENINTFFSPPKKKFKQDALPYTKLSKNEETPKEDRNDPKETKLTDVARTIAERQLSGLSKKQKSPVNIPTSKNIKPLKNEPKSPKISTSPKIVPSEKIVTPTKSPGVNKTKDIKSDGIPFPKLSKEDALKESEREVQNMMAKAKEQEKDEITGINGEEKCVMAIEIMDSIPNSETNGNCETPIGKKTPSAEKKTVSPISKEERQKMKEEKEMSKAARLKDMEEKRKKKEEEKVLKQVEKEKRENERKEKERLREEEKKKREDERKIREEEKQKKDELLRVEKEKRDAEKEKKELERKIKEEQRKQEEEKKKQDDEALKKKKEKEANLFRSFFTKKCTTNTKASIVELCQRFKPFQVKPDMLLAPLVRNNNINRELLDNILEGEFPNLNTYLMEQAINFAKHEKPKYITRRKKRRDLEEIYPIKTDCRRRETVERPAQNRSMDLQNVVIIDDNSNDAENEDTENDADTSVCDEKYLYISKLLQFCENTRPSYYGTWRKKPAHISGRKPFAMDTDTFNYDIDSDEEWIDEPGENLSDAADEDEEEEKETEDDQDGFFVPHGYLSDDEGIENELDEEDENNSEEATKCGSADKNEEDKLKLQVCSFEQRFQKKLKHQKPICIGITYSYSIESINPILKDYMKVPLFKPLDDKEKEEEDEIEVTSPQSAKRNGKPIPMTVPEEAMPILIRFVHGNVASLPNMIPKFREFWLLHTKENGGTVRSHISKRQLEKKIQAIASRVSNKEVGKMCYVVKDDVVTKYGLQNDLKYGEGLPELKSVNNASNQHDHEAIEIKDPESKNEAIQSEICVDTSMEIN